MCQKFETLYSSLLSCQKISKCLRKYKKIEMAFAVSEEFVEICKFIEIYLSCNAGIFFGR